MQCWYSYSYRNDKYVFGQGDMTCLRSSKIPLIPSKTKYPPGNHPYNLMPYKIIPRYGLRAKIGTTPIPGEHFCWDLFEMYYKITGSSAKLDQWNTSFVGIWLGQTPAIGGSGHYDRAACRDIKQTTATAAPDCNSSSSSVASRRWSRVLALQRVNPALAVAVGRMFHTAAVTQ